MAATTDMLRRLVGFDTVSANSNLDLIRWVADYLDGHGIATQLTYDEGRNKANLFASFGPEGDGGAGRHGYGKHRGVAAGSIRPWSASL